MANMDRDTNRQWRISDYRQLEMLAEQNMVMRENASTEDRVRGASLFLRPLLYLETSK